jgi:undecaprenyl-diphosphatase
MPHLRKHIERIAIVLQRLREVEWVPLAVMLAVAVAMWGFVELSDEVNEGDVAAVDRRILLAMRTAGDVTDPLGPPWFEELVRDVTALGSIGVLALVVAASCGFLWLQKNRMAVVYVVIAVLGALALSTALKSAYDRPRPDLAPHGARVMTASFPSGHSTMAAATYLTLGALLARYQAKWRLRIYLVVLAIVLAILVGLSRVYLSVHWPSDVLAGWTLGAAWALSCWGVAAYLQKRKVIEPPPQDSAPT